MWWAWPARVAGSGLVVVLLEDIFFTVLFPGRGHGLLRIPLSRAIWRLFRLAVYLLPRRRDRLLAYCGPVLVAWHVLAWVGLLAAGFALGVWPALGSAIQASHGTTTRGFATALYYSGYALTTLGTGDIVATTALYRLLMVLEAAIGFATVTMVLTYFLSVYGALARRNTFALSLHHRSAGSGDAAELLAGLGPGGDFDGGRQEIGAMGTALLRLLESHRAYPILRYFHFRQPYLALPRLLLLSLDTATLLRSALHPTTYRALVESAALAELWGGGLHLLAELGDGTPSPGRRPAGVPGRADWGERYRRAVARLQAAGIATPADLEAGAFQYAALRGQWDAALAALAAALACDWATVAPADGGRPAASGGAA